MDAAKLRSIPLFAGLPERELQSVARFADEVDVDEGRQLTHEGDFGYEFFAIESGTAEVRQGGECIARLEEGDFFGEMALVAHGRRNATVVATAPMTAIVMTGGQFRQMARDLPTVAERIRSAVEERGRALERGSAP